MILIIEDSDTDFEALKRAFERSGFEDPVHRCSTAEKAVEYIKMASDNEIYKQPCLIMLDLNLPGMSGIDFLQHIRSEEGTKMLPVLIFTSSNSEDDILECYRQGANSYFVKPLDVEKLYHIVDRVKEYWFQLSKIPSMCS